jgi:septal ring factor EnvC (AmiA/AmiB activator)
MERNPMERDEKIQRQMDFIIEQQAQFSVDIEKIQQSIGTLESVVTRLANASLNRLEENEEKIALLIDAQLRTEQKIEKLTDSQQKLSESQQTTDERLNAVIFMFEKFISRENGNSEK